MAGCFMSIESLTKFSTRRLRILWIVLGALLLVSVTPLWLYHRQALKLSEDKLQDTERVQQSEITRSLATETLQFEQGLREQLLSERQLLALTGWIENVDDPTHAPQLSRLLQDFAENNPNILYVTAVRKQAKGQSAGSFNADQDPFVQAALKRAFTSSIQGFDSISEPFALGQDNRPALVVSIPLLADGQFSGMVAAVVSLEQLQARLRDASVRDRMVYIVDLDGHIVAYPNTRTLVPGSDVTSTSPLAKQVTELPQDLRATQTTNFRMRSKDGRHSIDMIGTYSTIPELRWAVIAQRSLDDARVDAGVTELTSEALQFVVGVTFAALILGYLFAVGITRPIRRLSGIDARHQPRGVSRTRGGARRGGDRRTRRNVQPHGGRHRGARRETETGRRGKSRAIFGLDPHAGGGHRRKGSLYARPLRPGGQILAASSATAWE